MYTIGEHKRFSVESIIKKYLKEETFSFQINNINIKEDFKENLTSVTVDMSDGMKDFKVRGQSRKGAIHAFFKVLLKKYSKDYESISNISLVGFSVVPDFKRTKKGTDAVAEVLMEFKNQKDCLISFRNADSSYIRASFKSLLHGMEFFINLEKSSFHLLRCIEDADKRGRADLALKYKYDLAALVEINNFK